MTGLLILIMAFSSPFIPPDEIYVGKSFPWEIYYDLHKERITIEIYGIKYGKHDNLKSTSSTKDIIAKSDIGKLYRKGDDLYYANEELKINVKLEKKKYSQKIDNRRYKIFEIDAFNRISILKDSLEVKDYKFDWNVKNDYLYFRDNHLSDDYKPEYIRKFYGQK